MSNTSNVRKRAIGLGSTKQGAHHWLVQRLTGLALVPLGIWFVTSLVYLAGADYVTWRAWVSSPLTLALLGLVLLVSVHHALLGIQVVLEDYLKGALSRLVWLTLLRFVAWVLVALGFAALLLTFIGR